MKNEHKQKVQLLPAELVEPLAVTHVEVVRSVVRVHVSRGTAMIPFEAIKHLLCGKPLGSPNRNHYLK